MLNNQSELYLSVRKIKDASLQEKPGVFLWYCRKVVDAKNEGKLSIEDAGYRIAETMFIHELEDPLFDEIVGLAGSLELPFYISGVQPSNGWSRLVRLIDEYDRRLRDNNN